MLTDHFELCMAGAKQVKPVTLPDALSAHPNYMDTKPFYHTIGSLPEVSNPNLTVVHLGNIPTALTQSIPKLCLLNLTQAIIEALVGYATIPIYDRESVDPSEVGHGLPPSARAEACGHHP
jgi:hypothetical protein